MLTTSGPADHVGVVRALLDANLLPKYVSGTSAGGLIAALTCTRHDAELKRLLVPELADRITACEDSILKWGPRVWRTGARFDSRAFAQKAQFFTMGSMTFMEAYKRTGKVLNISVIPADRHSPVKLLNYVTAPDCVIWSALLASAAVPGIVSCVTQTVEDAHMLTTFLAPAQPHLPYAKDQVRTRNPLELGPPLQRRLFTHGHPPTRTAIALQRQLPYRLASQPARPPLLLCAARYARATCCASEGQRVERRLYLECSGACAQVAS